jgi:hypothetical protein
LGGKEVLSFIKKLFSGTKQDQQAEQELRDISKEEVKKAVSKFANEKREGVLLSVLVKDDNQIDYELLAPYLNGVPNKAYYMSKQTYEIFEDQAFVQTLDQIQEAVDSYIRNEKEFPIVDFDPEMRISYYKLTPYLKEKPEFETYLTEDEHLITWKNPETG